MTQPTTSLTKFKDCLRVPPTLHPQQMDDQRYSLRVQMRPAQIQLHSDLPPSEVWTYEGSLPGPIIEVARVQRVQIEWINALPADQPYPITAVTAPDGTQNEPGRSGRPANTTVAELVPWTVVHLHGCRERWLDRERHALRPSHHERLRQRPAGNATLVSRSCHGHHPLQRLCRPGGALYHPRSSTLRMLLYACP